jgi:hypothetical protein
MKPNPAPAAAVFETPTLPSNADLQHRPDLLHRKLKSAYKQEAAPGLWKFLIFLLNRGGGACSLRNGSYSFFLSNVSRTPSL